MSNRRIINEKKEITKALVLVVIYGKVFFWTASVPVEIRFGLLSNRNRKRYSLCRLACVLLINKLFSARIQETYLLLIR
jgi:hypothetical protein